MSYENAVTQMLQKHGSMSSIKIYLMYTGQSTVPLDETSIISSIEHCCRNMVRQKKLIGRKKTYKCGLEHYIYSLSKKNDNDKVIMSLCNDDSW